MRLEHTAIFGPDTVALADWYCRNFGMRIVWSNDAKPPTFFVADENGMCLEIIARPAEPAVADTGRVFHFAFFADDFDAAVRDLTAKGVALEAEGGGPGLRVRFFNDPAGNRCQIIWRAKRMA